MCIHDSLSCTVHVHVYTRASPTDILARKSARVGQKSDCRARRGTPRRLPHKDPRAEVGEEVRVGVRVGPVEFKLNYTLTLVTVGFLFFNIQRYLAVRPNSI